MKAVYKYNIFTQIRPAVFYYLIVLFVMFTFFGLSFIGDSNSMINGVEMATMIFVFVMSLVDFSENFNMLSINNISRRNIFICKILSFTTLALIMAFIDRLILGLAKLLAFLSEGYIFGSAITDIFTTISKNAFLAQIQMYMISVTSYLAVIAFGTLIAILFYRSNKLFKVLIAAGVPISITIIIPIILSVVMSTSAGPKLASLVGKLLGTPLNYTLTGLVSAVILGLLSWLVFRRISVKVQESL